jgi:hypothetical protein
MFLSFYFFAIISTQILHYSEGEYEERVRDSDVQYYEGSIFGHFQSFMRAMLALFQILTESSWHMIVLYAEVFNGFWISSMILLPFHMFITFIMRSILLGLIWEVFGIIHNTKSDENADTLPTGRQHI